MPRLHHFGIVFISLNMYWKLNRTNDTGTTSNNERKKIQERDEEKKKTREKLFVKYEINQVSKRFYFSDLDNVFFCCCFCCCIKMHFTLYNKKIEYHLKVCERPKILKTYTVIYNESSSRFPVIDTDGQNYIHR